MRSAPLSPGSVGTTTVSSVGGANWCSACARGVPIASPIRISPRPQSFPISPADTDARRVAAPRSKTSIAVTFRSASSPNRSRSRVRTVPENMRTYAIFSPAGPRSTLNTVPETGPSPSPSAAGSSSAMPAVSASTPAPVIAEPKKTGCTSARLVCAASCSRSRRYGTASPFTNAARSASSCSASAAANAASPSPHGVKPAARVPRSCTDPIGTIAGVSRSEIACSTRSASAPPRSILFTKSSVGTRSRCSARISTSVCACTPSTAEITSTAPSSTLSTRSTSAMKSGWPGVSIRLTVTSSIANDTTADLIVMPRCRSSARKSVCVLPSSTLPISSMTPAA